MNLVMIRDTSTPGMKPHTSIFDSDKIMPITESGCWIWIGSLVRGWYGQTSVNKKRAYVHRLAYEETYGPIPAGMFVCHKCDIPSCCNPQHLFLGTAADNIRDMVRKNRCRRAYPKNRGAGHFAAKLSDDMVREIRSSNESGRKLAKKFGVGPSTISRVRNNAKGGGWNHII